MTDVVNGASGADQKPSGTNGELSDETKNDKDSVAYDTYRKVLAEKKKRDEDLKAAQDELARLKKLEKERTEAELKAKEDYKKLVELREQELGEYKNKYEGLHSTIQESVKFNAFLEALPGQVPKKFWKMVDTSEIVIDPATGEPDPASVKKVADKFQAEFGEIIQTPGKAKLPNQAAGAQTAVINEQAWAAMSPKEKKDNLASYVEYKKLKGR